jgi:hypothetical protein
MARTGLPQLPCNTFVSIAALRAAFGEVMAEIPHIDLDAVEIRRARQGVT